MAINTRMRARTIRACACVRGCARVCGACRRHGGFDHVAAAFHYYGPCFVRNADDLVSICCSVPKPLPLQA